MILITDKNNIVSLFRKIIFNCSSLSICTYESQIRSTFRWLKDEKYTKIKLYYYMLLISYESSYCIHLQCIIIFVNTFCHLSKDVIGSLKKFNFK